MSESELLLGVDGGGSGTIAWLGRVGAPDTPLGRGAAGPSNPRVAGAEAAGDAIAAAVSAAFADAGLPRSCARAACLAVAGTGAAAWRHAVETSVRRHDLARAVRVTHDADAVLAAAGADSGVALIAGTGSLAWGRDDGGRVARAGGWGRLLGDEGSGFAIGVAALRAAARAADGRGPGTVLLDRLMAALDVREPRDLIDAVADGHGRPARVAALAPVVLAAAREGDAAARAVVSAAAGELADMVRAVHAALELPASGFTLSLAGGVLRSSASLRDAVLGTLRRDGIAPHAAVVTEPALGAIRLAQKEANATGTPP